MHEVEIQNGKRSVFVRENLRIRMKGGIPECVIIYPPKVKRSRLSRLVKGRIRCIDRHLHFLKFGEKETV